MPTLEREVAKRGIIRCEWVPGTMDRVRLCLPEREVQVNLDELQRIAGIDAVHELYLKGQVFLPLEKLREALTASGAGRPPW